MSNPSVVIGAGLGGLAAAVTLAARGHAVTVIERNPWVGGKAAVLEHEGYRFDMGPTILTVPSVLKRVFAEAGERLEDHVELVRLDPQWRSFFADGTDLDLAQDTGVMARRIGTFSGDGSSEVGYRRFSEISRRLADISRKYYFYKSVGGITDLFRNVIDGDESVLRLLADCTQIRAGRSVGGTIRAHIADPRVAQMLDHFTQYVGSAPDNSPAVLAGIANLQTDEGVWYPMGGIGAVPAALRSLALRLGVVFRTGVAVERIRLDDDGRAKSVVLADGETIEADAVVSNMDAVRTFDELVGGQAGRRFSKQWRGQVEPACSGVVLYLGLKERYEHLAHHNFVFSGTPEEEFHQIYEQGRPADKPTVYLCAPSGTEPGVAPPGGEALYALVHTPYLRPHHRWDALFPPYRERIFDVLAEVAGLHDLRDRIVFESSLTPADIHRRYRVLNGAIYGIASHGLWNGAFKPANRSAQVPGLYLAGGAAHPGPGMPMVLMSGWIAADTLHRDHVDGGGAIDRAPSPANPTSPESPTQRRAG